MVGVKFSVISFLSSFLCIAVLCVACQSYEPYVGAIVIDTDQPILYDGLLPIGVTLDSEEGPRDLLGTNLLINPEFEPIVGADVTRSTIIVSDTSQLRGAKLPYLYSDIVYGWKALGGNVSVVSDFTGYGLHLSATSNDSIAGILQQLYGFNGITGDSYSFSLEASSSGSPQLCVSFVDDSLRVCSNKAVLQIQNDRASHHAHLTIMKDCPSVHLMIEMKVNEGEPIQVVSDSTTYWTKSRRATLQMSHLQLSRAHQKSKYGLDSNLLALLDSLSLGFVRFPSGATANKLPFASYPLNNFAEVDSTQSLLRLQGEQGNFNIGDLLSLADYLGCSPIYLFGFGFSVTGDVQRVEDIKLFPKRIQQVDYLLSLSNSRLGVQLGYNSSSAEYDRRFAMLLEEIQPKYSSLQLIRGGTALDFHKYSDFTEDIILPRVNYDNLASIDSMLTRRDPFLFPQMISEVAFDVNSKEGYYLPPLALRAAFLIMAEKRTPYIKSLGIVPLLATTESSDLPLIRVISGQYIPTALYECLHDFMKFRGSQLPKDETSKPLSADILVSLSCDEEQSTYYLKAVNVTRHPLNYQIKAKGKNSSFSYVETLSYTPKESFSNDNTVSFIDYERHEARYKLPLSKSMNYLFAPYEVVFFKFQ